MYCSGLDSFLHALACTASKIQLPTCFLGVKKNEQRVSKLFRNEENRKHFEKKLADRRKIKNSVRKNLQKRALVLQQAKLKRKLTRLV